MQKLIIQNNKRENTKRIPHQYTAGDSVMVRLDPNRKHGSDRYEGPFIVNRVNDNGTLRLSKVAPNGGAVYSTWNIRNVDPCMD